jgi:hypothetical protein
MDDGSGTEKKSACAYCHAMKKRCIKLEMEKDCATCVQRGIVRGSCLFRMDPNSTMLFDLGVPPAHTDAAESGILSPSPSGVF